MEARRIGGTNRTWALYSDSSRCQPLKYLKSHQETAPKMMARIKDVDANGPPQNQELFRWLDRHRHRGLRLCEYKVHHPRACRAYAFLGERGFVIVRIEDKTDSNRGFNEAMERVKSAIDEFLEGGEVYVDD